MANTKHQTPVFLSQNWFISTAWRRISSINIHLSALNYDDYLGLITGSEKESATKHVANSKGPIFIFSQVMFFFWWILFPFSQISGKFCTPESEAGGFSVYSGGVLRWSEIPNGKKTQPTAPKVPKWQKQGLRLHSPQEFSHMAVAAVEFFMTF